MLSFLSEVYLSILYLSLLTSYVMHQNLLVSMVILTDLQNQRGIAVKRRKTRNFPISRKWDSGSTNTNEACTKSMCHQFIMPSYPEDILQWVVYKGPGGPQKNSIKI
jgi:hypothetical protein